MAHDAFHDLQAIEGSLKSIGGAFFHIRHEERLIFSRLFALLRFLRFLEPFATTAR